MGDDRADLIDTHLKQLASFRESVNALAQGPQGHQVVTREWSTLKENLATAVLPRLGSAVQLASKSMMALVTSCLNASVQTDGLTHEVRVNVPNAQPPQQVSRVDFSGQFRHVWIGLISGQIVELEQLLRTPPVLTISPAHTPPAELLERPDRDTAKSLLDEAVTEVDRRGASFRWSGYVSLVAGIVSVGVAVAMPFMLEPHGTISGWAFAAAWGVRILAIAVLVIASVHFVNVFRDMMGRAATAARERALLRVLAASSYLGTGKDQASALVELVKTLAQEPSVTKRNESALVVPAALMKELPEIIKLFKPEK